MTAAEPTQGGRAPLGGAVSDGRARAAGANVEGTPSTAAAPTYRQRLTRAIFAACKRRGLDEETRHAIVARITGQQSMTTCNDHQLGKVLAAINGGGAPTPARPALSPKQRLMFSLWQQLADAGLVRDRKMSALQSWVRSQTKVERLQWLTGAQENTVIEQMKLWLQRG